MIDLLPHQETCVNYHLYHEYSINGSQMGCISGSASVKINRGGCSRTIRLDSLYEKFKSGTLTRTNQAYIRGFDGERVRLLLLNEVIFSGVKNTFTIKTTDGLSIRATSDHEFLTNYGWVRVDCLDISKHLVATDMTTKHSKKEIKSQPPKMRYNLRTVGVYHPYGQKISSVKNRKRIEVHRAVKEAQINGMGLEAYIAATKDESSAKKLKYIDPKKYHVHHINRDHRDHRPENLEVLSSKDHYTEHSTHSYKNFGHGGISWKSINSITPHGEEPVYDLKVEAPFHNFACNKFIVHNCGKSIIALEFMRLTGKTGLVVAPSFLKSSWVSEATKHGFQDFEFIPYSILHKVKPKDIEHCKVWVADEVTYLKNPEARRTFAYYKLLKDTKPDYWLGLSATPIRNRVYDLWVPLAICSQAPNNSNGLRLTGDLTKFRGFSRHFCNVEIIRVRDKRIERFGSIKEDKIPELRALLKDKYIRFSLNDVIKDMPELIEKEITFTLTETPGLEEEFLAYMEGSKVDPKAKAASALIKAPETLKYLETFKDNDERAIVFTDHIKSARLLAEGLGCPCITGGTSAHDRGRIVQEFQEDKHQFLVATIGALSVGVTLTKSRHVVFNDLSWTHADNIQARARIHRIGQKDTCIAHYMYGSDTDALIKRTLEAKAASALKVLGHE